MRRTTQTAFAAACLGLFGFFNQQVNAAAITPGNVMIYRVGAGTTALSTAATAVFMDEYTPAGALVQSIGMPQTGTLSLTANGTSTAEGIISRTDNGQYIVLTGYRKDVGGTSPNSDTSAVTPRVVGRLDLNGNFDTSTGLTDAFSGLNIRSVASTNGSEFWMGGSLNARYATFGATTSTAFTTNGNVNGNFRGFQVVNNQLYLTSGAANPGRSVFKTTPALPTSGDATLTATFPVGSDTTIAWQQFLFADLSAVVAGNDTLYVANQGTSATNPSGVYKFVFDGTTWTAAGSIPLTTASGLTGTVTAGNVTLFAISGTNAANTLQVATDTGGTGAITGSFASIATAGANTAFRSLSLAPNTVPEPTTAIVLLAAAGLVRRRR